MSSLNVGQGLDLRYAPINASTSGSNTIVEGIEGRALHLVSFYVIATSAVTFLIEDTASNDLTGGLPFLANGGIVVPGSASSPWAATAEGEGLAVNLDSAVQVGGGLTYLVVAE